MQRESQPRHGVSLNLRILRSYISTPSPVSRDFVYLPSDRLKAAGCVILSSATTVVEARWLEDHGVDAAIAQGVEAGGSRAMFLTSDLELQLGTLVLVPDKLIS